MLQHRITQINIYLIIIFLFTILFVEAAVAAEAIVEAQPYILEAKGEIIYDYQHGKMLATEGVVFKTEGLSIEADEVIINIEETLVEARGELIIWVEDQLITGNYLKFDYQTLTGSIQGAESKLGNILFKGREIKFIQDADYQMEITDTSFTDCLFSEPHYHISARQIRLYPQNKIVAKNVGLYLGKTRLFTFPTYVVEYQPGEEGGFKNLMPVPQLGYNSAEGWSARVYYPYEIDSSTKGSITAEYTQKGERDIELEHQYQLKEDWYLTGIYNNLVEEDDEGNFNREETLSGGVIYQNSPLLIKSLLSYDLLNQEYTSRNTFQYTTPVYRFLTALNYNFNNHNREEKLSLEYSPYQKTNLAFYQEYENEILNKESYGIRNEGMMKWDISYRDGYEVDYLPYLTVKLPEFKVLNTSLKTGIGLGKQENEGITAAKLDLNLALDRKITITPELALDFKGEITDVIYQQEETSYLAYQFEAGSNLSRNINDKVQIEGSLGYLLVRDRGDPLLPADRIDLKEALRPSLKFIYQLPQEGASWEFEIAGEYSLPEKEMEELTAELTRKFDCYHYSLTYNLLDNSFGISIEF